MLQFVIEEHWGEGHNERIPKLAEELASRKPAVVVTNVVDTALAMARIAPHVPIVQGSGGDLVNRGLAKSLARPGGMVTGLTNLTTDLNGKRVELLIEAVPQHSASADFSVTDHPALLELIRSAFSRHSIKPLIVGVSRPNELEGAINRLSMDRAQVLYLTGSAWFSAERDAILSLALKQRWPVIGDQSVYAEAGALLSYGTNRAAQYRRAAYYVDRILRGATPGDLPIEQPMTFELVVNLKTAKALGLTMPPEIMVQAARVIQ